MCSARPLTRKQIFKISFSAEMLFHFSDIVTTSCFLWLCLSLSSCVPVSGLCRALRLTAGGVTEHEPRAPSGVSGPFTRSCTVSKRADFSAPSHLHTHTRVY